jgi:hypothetical protein
LWLRTAALVEDYQRLAVLAEPAPIAAPASPDSNDDHILAADIA